MYGYALLIVVCFFVYRTLSSRRPTQLRPVEPPVPRSEALGDAGEAIADAEIRRVLTWLCGENYYLHQGAVLLHHAPGTAYPTAEIDHLAVTPFGLFVFETKNWAGRIEPGPDSDTVTRIAADGTRDVRRSPLRQNRSKVAFLRSVLPGMWPVHGFGVFASPSSVLSPELPPALLRIDDIAQQMRMCKARFEESGQRSLDIQLAWSAVLSVGELCPLALAEHRSRVRMDDKSRHAFS
ncbi:NERD domain-containing protein (plasmid) [Paraburkholderia sp. D15]|uniref:nuclease-related domain-containing protein n=1 Tax=Paraburkholderia sp. D15 TaxID=2880218 RepID=UPI00247A99DB|nr:nuclease-related domain-containing protein [Paraburkholderia sp. D15]WGS55099.1 NERD domain-containing protein [Paraburkholderia sp. D15]